MNILLSWIYPYGFLEFWVKPEVYAFFSRSVFNTNSNSSTPPIIIKNHFGFEGVKSYNVDARCEGTMQSMTPEGAE